jgi:superfamily I DNA/RNA helicase
VEDTIEQRAIIDYVAAGSGSLLVQALAGTGKTTTLIRSLARIPQRSVLLCAFNKRIADELQAKVPPMPKGTMVNVRTFHSQGLAMLRDHYKVDIDKTATEALINRAAGAQIGFRPRRAAVNLLRTLKETTASATVPTHAAIHTLGLDYNLFEKLPDAEITLACDLVHSAYLLSLDFRNRRTIDFCDMVWAPVALGLTPKSRYQAVIVDELQDISPPQFAMLRKLLVPGGRFVGIGDPRQQIYGWRGSMGDAAWQAVRTDLAAETLPLTTTWRCAAAIVKQANAIVPALNPRPGAPAGRIDRCAWADLARAITGSAAKPWQLAPGGNDTRKHTFVLSRANASLLDCALFLWRERVRFELNAGQELLEPLFEVLANKLDLRTPAMFAKSLAAWKATELARAEKAHATAHADRIEEQAAMLGVAAGYAAPAQIKQLLLDILTPNGAGVLLSTVHKVKGLEAPRVFLLKQTFARHKVPTCRACGGTGAGEGTGYKAPCGSCDGTGKYEVEIPQEELNIEYVGITRAIDTLVWVDLAARTPTLAVVVSSTHPAELQGEAAQETIKLGVRELADLEDRHEVDDGEENPQLDARFL